MWSPVESLWKFDTWGYNNSSANRKKKDCSPFLARTQAMKSHGLCKSPPNLLFPALALWGLKLGSPHMQTSNCNSLLILDKPIFAGEIFCSLSVSGQQRVGINTLGDPWKTLNGKLSTWYLWKDTSLRLIRCRSIKTKKTKNKLQEINLNLLGSLFCCKDIPINLTIPLECSTSCLRLWLLYKITKTHQSKHSLGTDQGQRKSPGKLTQLPSTCGFLTVNEE